MRIFLKATTTPPTPRQSGGLDEAMAESLNECRALLGVLTNGRTQPPKSEEKCRRNINKQKNNFSVVVAAGVVKLKCNCDAFGGYLRFNTVQHGTKIARAFICMCVYRVCVSFVMYVLAWHMHMSLLFMHFLQSCLFFGATNICRHTNLHTYVCAVFVCMSMRVECDESINKKKKAKKIHEVQPKIKTKLA